MADTTIPYAFGTYNWTSGYGPRIDPLSGLRRDHWGVDLAPKQPGLKLDTGSIITGTITVPAFEANGAGNNIWMINGQWWWKIFHLDRIDVRTGQHVEAGEHVGIMGTTGASTGVHGHLELWINGVRVDPTPYLLEAERAGRFHGSTPAPAPAPTPEPTPSPEDDPMLAISFNGAFYSLHADRSGKFWLWEDSTAEVAAQGLDVVAIPAPGTDTIDAMWERYPHVGGPFAS